ncbi:alpha-ketoglutarate-dependent dioxygenase AlkB [Leisingera sp. SS27]|uniref:alpha-ketoglutarate-dependent dioxygenase AlkB family protein n=1 Tax=Leisingera sp. SS27 TaxID=2979462 RepID=UPI00232DDABC|nr:alpha-ketoglutarate-dependent dioxygenase AlkB [Leisingera sp. SS27]MDC0659164.1 alpha-ketoglutarate-dependent dioxygenase AlkB [Leisingera sp. SS27]
MKPVSPPPGSLLADRPKPLLLRGIQVWKECLDPLRQQALIDALRPVLKAAPLFSPEVPGGGQMSVRMTSAGQFGWYSDAKGYRYAERHPAGREWPAIPAEVLDIWRALTGLERQPECCLLNYYGEGARMGLHQDKDEADFSFPVVSISLGDDGLFRIGNQTRGGKTESVWLSSGDVVVMGGAARLTYHGVDRIRFKSSRLLPKGGRINLTLRVVT